MILIGLLLFTAFMGYHASQVKVSYTYGGLLPKDDSTRIALKNFKKKFEKGGNILVLGVEGDELYQVENFRAWYQLGEDLKDHQGIDSVFSEANLYTLRKNDSLKRFDIVPVMRGPPEDQAEMDSLYERIRDLPFFRGMLYSDSTNASLMMLYFDHQVLDSKARFPLVDSIEARAKTFQQETGIDVHFSGMPYIRAKSTSKVQAEMKMFMVLAVVVTALILFFFFRSGRVVFFSMLVVGIGVLWSLGSIHLLGFQITMLMGLIPPVIIVIGIPNCVFLLNKYHNEYNNHGNKAKALTRVIHKIGNATFLTNTTTAFGFATFIFTESTMLSEFGVVAALNVLGIFLLSLLIIPIAYSFQPVPKTRHLKHLERQWVSITVGWLANVVKGHRNKVYAGTLLVLFISGVGMSLVRVTGKMVEGMPKDDAVMVDLQFFQDHFNGILPFEIFIEAEKKGQITSTEALKKVDELQEVLAEYPQLSRSFSLVDVVKFGRQAFYNGNPERYDLPKRRERSFIAPYFKNEKGGRGSEIRGKFIGDDRKTIRITANVADIGTIQMERLLEKLRPRIGAIFNDGKYEVNVTGQSVAYYKGTTYLVKNLFISLSIAIAVIAIFMAVLFNSWRIVMVSLVPNVIPLLITAGIMGFFGVTVKPSTILVFSIAFGISVDDTIHFLAKYRQELRNDVLNLREAVFSALNETGVSMIYTSVVLFFGFSIFILSDFGGTSAMGSLISVSLLVAMVANLVLLPSMLLSLERLLRPKRFRDEPYFQLVNEREERAMKEPDAGGGNGDPRSKENITKKDQ